MHRCRKDAASAEALFPKDALSSTARIAETISPYRAALRAEASSRKDGNSALRADAASAFEEFTMASTEVVFLSAVRTAFGTFGGSLRDVPVIDFTTVAAKAAIERSGVDASDIDSAMFGNILYTAPDSPYFARHVALKSGMKDESSALTLNRLCGSGFQSVVSGAQEIMLGDSTVCLVGGADSMSQAPHTAHVRWGLPLGKAPQLEDTLWAALTDRYAGLPMAETAENLAEKYKLDRSCIDEFALRSQHLARDAWAAGAFKDEVVGVPVKNPKTKQTEMFEKDEHMRP